MARSCADCRQDLTPIRILGVSPAAYAPLDAKPSIWDGRYAPAGSIHTWMCPECGRVRLYAETARDSLPLPSAPPEPDTASLPRPAGEAEPND